MKNWIEVQPNDWTYELKCPNCGFIYSPQGYEDGTVDFPYKFCPSCGEKIDEPIKPLKEA